MKNEEIVAFFKTTIAKNAGVSIDDVNKMLNDEEMDLAVMRKAMIAGKDLYLSVKKELEEFRVTMFNRTRTSSSIVPRAYWFDEYSNDVDFKRIEDLKSTYDLSSANTKSNTSSSGENPDSISD